MNTIRCSNCGFLNFVTDPSCKRCKATFEDVPPPATQQFAAEFQPAFQGGYQTQQWPQPAYNPYALPTPVAPLPKVSKNSSTNAGLWVLLTIAVAVAVGIGVLWKANRSAPTINGWQEYRAPDNSFTVQMPVKAFDTVQSQMTPAGQIQMHIAAGMFENKGIYMVGYADYPSSFDPSRVPTSSLLNAAADGAVNNSGATMVSKKSLTVDGREAIEAEMTIPSSKLPGGGKAVCRIFWAAPRVYILFVGGQDSSGVYESRDRFLNSFKILR